MVDDATLGQSKVSALRLWDRYFLTNPGTSTLAEGWCLPQEKLNGM